MGIKWAPWFNVPMHRRLEVLSVAFVLICATILCPICYFLMGYLLIAGNIYWRIICTSYLAFFLYDINAGDRGGHGAGSAWVRNWSVWKHAKNYFPVDLVKTVDLPPDRNYLICAFPHGVFSFGIVTNFCSSHSKWSTFFPGVRSKMATIGLNTSVPIMRDLFLSLGMCSASANSLTTLLNQPNDPDDKSNQDGYTSNAVALLVGGIREQRYYTYPDRYRFLLKNRRGFVRIALQTGASLVPTILFGENNLYDVIDYKPSWLRRIFRDIDNWPPFSIGRGFFQYNFGPLPKRYPITTVIGAPIHVEKIPNPSDEDINKTHELFCNRIIELFEEHKSKYVKNFENIHVQLV